MDKKTKNRIFFWLRIAIALIFIAIIVLTVDLKATWEELKQTDPVYVALAAGAYICFLAFLTLRWFILSKARRHPYGVFYLYRSVLIHMLFNNVLPTTIGGDVYRIVDTSGHEGKRVAFSIVWTDRMVGFIGVFSFAFLASIFYAAVSGNFLLLAVFGAAFIFAISLILAFLSTKINAWLSPWLSKLRVFKYPLGEKIAGAFRSITDYRNHKTALLAAVIVSLGVQISLAGIWYLLFRSLGGQTSFIHIMVTIPIVNTLAMFSVGGWGLREQTFVQMLATFAVAKETALATSVLFDVVNVFFGLLGGVFLLFRRGRKPAPSPVGSSD
ncbi:MAG: lysylphosphatidylglycerol synthase transmembrane domain-containing protein [candidate division WOR-3 bacterium]|nr:lysylphosphatidylglycerol synthase transmembrane domain-containing protein [candidate division WOR-3 bacterium]